jgi:hypothetical protein
MVVFWGVAPLPDDCMVSTSEMSVNIHQTTLRNIPEDSHFHARRLENLKSQKVRL